MRLHEFVDSVGMVSTDDDMVVANRMLQQIGFQVHVERDLCSTEMVAVRRFDGFSLCDEITVKF